MELHAGLIDIGEKETDYIFGEDAGIVLISQSDSMNENVKIFEYNQGAEYETRNWCTIFSAFTELSFLLQKQFTIDEIKQVGHKMIEDKKLDPNVGAYLSDAIDYTRKWYNENHEDKIVSYQIDYTDEYLLDMLINKITRLTQIGYKVSTKLFSETEETGHASQKDYPKGGGHAVSLYGLNIIDNYFGKRKQNRYSFDYMQDLIKNGVIYRKGYLFLKI